jgi:hypothetical protein
MNFSHLDCKGRGTQHETSQIQLILLWWPRLLFDFGDSTENRKPEGHKEAWLGPANKVVFKTDLTYGLKWLRGLAKQYQQSRYKEAVWITIISSIFEKALIKQRAADL